MLTDTCAVITRPVMPADWQAVASLSARVFGPGRFVRSAYRVREKTPFASPFCRIAIRGERVIAAIRMTPISVGKQPGALLLGPLAVDPDFANQGHGRRLIAESIDAARAGGIKIVVLVGNMSYYGRLGFEPVPDGQMRMPGPVDPARLLALELQPGTLHAFEGLIAAQV